MLKSMGWPDREGALSEVAKHLGMTDEGRTLSRWAKGEQNPPPDYLVEEKKVELSELLTKEIVAALGEMKNARDSASYRDLGTVAAILIDKRQLLNDLPTEHIKESGAPVPVQRQSTGPSTLPVHIAPGAASGNRIIQEV